MKSCSGPLRARPGAVRQASPARVVYYGGHTAPPPDGIVRNAKVLRMEFAWMSGAPCIAHTPTHGYEPTREAAMAAFAKSWRRELVGKSRFRGQTGNHLRF